MSLNIISLFSGAGGLDLGFKQAGFNTIWANEFDKNIHKTFKKNFPEVDLNEKSLLDISYKDIPDSIGIIGGPPCQSWSIAGKQKGKEDPRGKLFLNL
jgi:DNA (cytosine-5)-methyltransferase 1